MNVRAVVVLLLAGLPALAADTGPVSIQVEEGKAITFKLGDQLVTRYHLAPTVAKPYFWPVLAPGNLAVTRAWPMNDALADDAKDHVHQKSIWFCHGDIIPEGIEIKSLIKGVKGVDFWSEAPGAGKIVCVKVGEPKIEGDKGSVTTINEWRTATGKKILTETRTISLHNLGGTPLLVLDIDLHADVYPITFGDTKEGSMGVRVRTSLTEKSGKGLLTNAEGKTTEGSAGNKAKKGVWGLVSDWCDYSGPVDGKEAGIAVFADPANALKSAWHSRGYGLMAANPFGRAHSGFPDQVGKNDLVKLGKGEHLRLRFGILLHAGDVKAGKVAERFQQFTRLGK